MAGKSFPVVVVESVPWATGWAYTRGTYGGLPLLSQGWAPRGKLATFRQLRKLGLRPGGAYPVAVLYGRHNASGKTWFASLYLIGAAVPVRPMTPAKWAALAKANAAKRICPDCGQDRGYVIPPSLGMCLDCSDDNDNEKEAA